MAQRSEPAVQTFLFADLSGFTALTEAHGDEQAADLVGGFCVAVRQLLAEHQAQEVKTIGDALMLRTGDAAAAIRLGLCIVHDVGEALLTAATRAAAGEVEEVELRQRGRWTFRNVAAPVLVYAAVRQGPHSSSGLPIDPVCRMAVDPRHGVGRLTHEGVEYCFCSLGCAGAFAQQPAKYTATNG
jgi:adenylate cyclase